MLFRKKSNEEKVADEMAKKKAQIDKLKQEMIDMGKFVLKDGKLQKAVETSAPVEAPVQAEQVQQQIPPQQVVFDEPEFELPPQQYTQQPRQPQYVPQPQFQQQYAQQPQQYRAPVREIPPTSVNIEMVNGTVIQINVPVDRMESFIEEMNAAIDNQSSLPVGNQIINGRNVVVYTFQE